MELVVGIWIGIASAIAGQLFGHFLFQRSQERKFQRSQERKRER